MLILSFLSLLLALTATAVPLSVIFRRLGYSPAWGLLAFVPLVYVLLLWILALRRWPALTGHAAHLEETFS